jgi:hypothetical protein
MNKVIESIDALFCGILCTFVEKLWVVEMHLKPENISQARFTPAIQNIAKTCCKHNFYASSTKKKWRILKKRCSINITTCLFHAAEEWYCVEPSRRGMHPSYPDMCFSSTRFRCHKSHALYANFIYQVWTRNRFLVQIQRVLWMIVRTIAGFLAHMCSYDHTPWCLLSVDVRYSSGDWTMRPTLFTALSINMQKCSYRTQ